MTDMHIWLLITAVIFTFYGRWTVKSVFERRAALVVEFTIDRLVADGFIKTKLTENGETELVRHDEQS